MANMVAVYTYDPAEAAPRSGPAKRSRRGSLRLCGGLPTGVMASLLWLLSAPCVWGQVEKAAGAGEPGVFPPQAQVNDRVYTYGSISIQQKWAPCPPTSPFGNTSAHGYAAYRFTVQNRSSAAQRITLTLPANHDSTSKLYLTRTVDVGPAGAVEVSLLQPNLSFYPGNSGTAALAVAIDGVPQAEPIIVVTPDRSNTLSSGLGMNDIPVRILSHPAEAIALNQLLQGQKMGAVGGGMMRGVQAHHVPVHAKLPGWSKHWLAYTCLDGIVLEGAALERAPAEVQNALWQYVEAGGSLLILGPCPVPGSWRQKNTTVAGLVRYHGGFGVCLVSAERALLHTSEPARKLKLAQEIIQDWNTSVQPWLQAPSADRINQLAPVVEQRGLPIRSIFLLMMGFAIVAGPINLYVLGQLKRRLWILWTVPAFSLLGCLAIFAYMMLYEGWQGYVRMEGLTLLDETSQRATTVGWFGVYAPLTPGEGLHFDTATELTPAPAQSGRYSHQDYQRREWQRTLDWTIDQHLASGWVSARVPTYFLLRRGERRLERVLVRTGPDQTLTIVNGLKGHIQTLWLADADGKVYSAAAVPAGAEAKLQPAQLARNLADNTGSLRRAYEEDWLRLATRVAEHPEEYLRPGCYIAVLEDTPFLENGYRDGQPRESRSVVFGIMKEPFHAN